MPYRSSAAVKPLVDHLSATTALPPAQVQRLVEDVLAYFDETVEDFANRRHAELKTGGARNDAIFEQLIEEIRAHRFVPQELSARQIRRLIYG